MALFGMTAKEWKESNPELAKKGNIRDYTDLLHLVILNNLQNTSAELIEDGLSQRERLIRLNKSTKRQMKSLQNSKSMKDLELLQKQVKEERKAITKKTNNSIKTWDSDLDKILKRGSLKWPKIT